MLERYINKDRLVKSITDEPFLTNDIKDYFIRIVEEQPVGIERNAPVDSGVLDYKVKCEDLKKHVEKQAAEITYLNELLKDRNLQVEKLNAEMDVVRLIFGGGNYGK